MKAEELEFLEWLELLCISIVAHSLIEEEVVLNGTGTNASEAANMAFEIISKLRGSEGLENLRHKAIREARALCRDYTLDVSWFPELMDWEHGGAIDGLA